MYLEKNGMPRLATFDQKKSLRCSWNENKVEASEVKRRLSNLFTSEYDPGSMQWKLDARRFIADIAKSTTELVPPAKHVTFQVERVLLVVFQYWSNVHSENLSAETVKSYDKSNGFDESGLVLLKREEDMRSLAKPMSKLVAKCASKGKCSNRKCSCVKRVEASSFTAEFIAAKHTLKKGLNRWEQEWKKRTRLLTDAKSMAECLRKSPRTQPSSL